jgi:hypothetical protein
MNLNDSRVKLAAKARGMAESALFMNRSGKHMIFVEII